MTRKYQNKYKPSMRRQRKTYDMQCKECGNEYVADDTFYMVHNATR